MSAWEQYVREMRQLRLRAGDPSIREVTERTAVSRATVHSVLRLRQMPTVQALQQVVQALDGDVNRFEQLWLDYQHEHGDLAPGPSASFEERLIEELAALRELLEERLPVHEVTCPTCEATIRARMADR